MITKKFYSEKNGNYLELRSLNGVLVESFIIQGMPKQPKATPDNLDDRVKGYLRAMGGILQSKPEPKTGVIDKSYIQNKVKEGDIADEVESIKQSIKTGTINKKGLEDIVDSLDFYRTLIDEILSRTEDLIF